MAKTAEKSAQKSLCAHSFKKCFRVFGGRGITGKRKTYDTSSN